MAGIPGLVAVISIPWGAIGEKRSCKKTLLDICEPLRATYLLYGVKAVTSVPSLGYPLRFYSNRLLQIDNKGSLIEQRVSICGSEWPFHRGQLRTSENADIYIMICNSTKITTMKCRGCGSQSCEGTSGRETQHHRFLRLLRVLICCSRSKMAPGTLGEAAKRNQGQGHRDDVARYDRLRI